MRWPQVLGLIVAALAVLHGAFQVATVRGPCTTEASDPGEPDNPTVCGHTVPLVGVVVVLLGAAGFIGLALGRAMAAWAAAWLMLGLSLLFGFSLGFLIYDAVGVLAGIAVWRIGARLDRVVPPAAS